MRPKEFSNELIPDARDQKFRTLALATLKHIRSRKKLTKLQRSREIIALAADGGRARVSKFDHKLLRKYESDSESETEETLSIDEEETKSVFSGKAFKYGTLTVLFATSARILDAYTGQIESKGTDGETSTLAMMDSIIVSGLGFIILVGMYMMQKNSFRDLTFKHIVFIGIISIFELVQGTCDLIGTWINGATVASLFNGIALITNAIVQKIKFKEPWYKADIIAVLLATIGLAILFAKDSFNKNDSDNGTCISTENVGSSDCIAQSSVNKPNKNLETIGLIILTVGQILKAFEFVLEEHVMKMPMPQKSNNNIDKNNNIENDSSNAQQNLNSNQTNNRQNHEDNSKNQVTLHDGENSLSVDADDEDAKAETLEELEAGETKTSQTANTRKQFEYPSTNLVLGIEGILGTIITALIVTIFEFTPSIGEFKAVNGKMISTYDFLYKCVNSWSLMLVVLASPFVFVLWSWAANGLVQHSNSIARQMLCVARAIPVWIVTVFIAKDKNGQALQKFDATKWNEYLVFVAFIFFIGTCCVFFEIGVPEWLKRKEPDDVKMQIKKPESLSDEV